MLSVLRNLEIPPIENWSRLVAAVVVFVLGLIVIRVTALLVLRGIGRNLREQYRDLLRKIIVYTGGAVLLVAVLNAAGVSVGALLGAAGVVGIAVGIASQASLSNIISGLFLVSERFFEIGDVVRVGEQTGVIYSIDLLSIKIRTFDNVLIRIPNQQLIEQNIVNITRFPIRRMDFVITVPLNAPVQEVLAALREATTCSGCALVEPEALCLFKGYAEGGAQYTLGVWFERTNFVKVRNGISAAVQRALRERGIAFEVQPIRIVNSDTITEQPAPAMEAVQEVEPGAETR